MLSSLLLCLDEAPIFFSVESDTESYAAFDAALDLGYVLWGAFGWIALFVIFLVINSKEWAANRRRSLSDRSSRRSGSRFLADNR